MAIFSYLVDSLVWSSKTTSHSRQFQRARVLLGMEPDLKTFTITMPTLGVFIFGTALCCFCCFKYGLKRWYKRAIEKAQTKSRTDITYVASLRNKTAQLEQALKKVTKLQKVEPTRRDLKYEAVALKEGLRLLHEHLRNSERYIDYCERQKQPSLDSGENKSISMDAQGNSFVNPTFSSQQAINSGYMVDCVKESGGEEVNPTSSDEECCNPKHRELELYLMTTGGAILPSMLQYPGSAPASPPTGCPGASARGSRTTSPLRRQEIDSGGRSLGVSPDQQGQPQVGLHSEQAFATRMQSPTQLDTQHVQSPPGMPQNWQQTGLIVSKNFGSRSRLEV